MTIHIEGMLAEAVRHFWDTRESQYQRQGEQTGSKDIGERGAVTGGKHADGFLALFVAIVRDAGLREADVRFGGKPGRTLPGYFRPSKEWDLLIVNHDRLVAVIEAKSQVGSFGNNYNNRVEEAVGSATDLWAAYEHGLFHPSVRPWVGYFFMLEDKAESVRPTKRMDLSPFQVDSAFQTLSFAAGYEQTCLRLVRQRLYDAACLITSNAESGRLGSYRQLNPEIGIQNFALSLRARAAAFANS